MNVAMIEVLEKAASQDINVLKSAEETLREWEIQRGFYTTLYNVFSNHSLPVNVRWMAVLYFKNGVDRYWRKNAPNGIGEDEKEFLRRNLIANFDEPVNQVATFIAEIIGKIARLDCPREWDNLIPTLLDVIRGPNSIAQHRGLLTLHYVIKTLASKRLHSDRNMFRQLTANIFNFTLNSWNTYTESFLILASNGADANQIREALEMALLLLRILRKLIVDGFTVESISKSEDAMLFLKVIFERAKACLECRKTLMLRGIQVESLEKFIIHLTKILNGTLENYPFTYIELIPATLEFTVFYCFTATGMPFTFEKFVIQSLNLMKSILINDNYQHLMPRDRVDATKRSAAVRVIQLKEEFFTLETVKEICSKLVTHYFLLTQSDLEMWDTDPEGYAVDTDESWKYNLRACTQTVFLSMFSEFGGSMTPVLIDLMQTYYRPVDPNDCAAILMKDAVYLAVGLIAIDLWDDVDFDQWFSTTLKEELQIKDNHYRIIKRRVCWLIGKWIRVKLDQKLRPELYELMIGALSSEEDLVVRLEASCTLRQALDDFYFICDEFMPFLERIFSLLFDLLREATECDTKMQVLNVLSYVIEQVGQNIRPYVAPLSAYLPSLWQISENHNMLKCAIISTLVHYVKALGAESAVVEPMIVSMVGVSCDLNQDAHVYLLEDGLELWLAVLENATVLTSGMINLFRNMPALLDSGLDQVTFGPAMSVIKAYVSLSPQEFISEWGARIIDGIKTIFMDLRAQELIPVIELLEFILEVATERGAQLIKPLLGRIFKIVYFDESNSSRVMITSLVVVARVLISSRDVFAQVISELTGEVGGEETEETVLGRIIEIWLLRMSDNIGEKRCSKCNAIALCSLLNSNSPPVVFAHFAVIISNIVEVLNDIMVLDLDGIRGVYDSLLLTTRQRENHHAADNDEEEYKTEHQIRIERLYSEDLVYTICLKDFLQSQLTTLRRVMGNNQFDQLIATLRPDIDQQLREYVEL